MASMTIKQLIASETHGLWHGTRAPARSSLRSVAELLVPAKNAMKVIWTEICANHKQTIEELHSGEVWRYFPPSHENLENLANSIRITKDVWHYGCVAFATGLFAARDYAKNGSELANATLALLRSTMDSMPQVYEEAVRRIGAVDIERVERIASELLNGSPKVYRLVRVPPKGFFSLPGAPDKPVEEFVVSRWSKVPPELFFNGEVPLDCVEDVT